MNNEATTTGGYANSAMVKAIKDDTTGLGETGSTLHKIYETYIKPDFDKDTSDGKKHVIEYRNYLTTKVDATATNNRMGSSTVKGASSYWAWYPRKIDLMSEMNVYGGIVASSSMYDTGIDNRQYAIFRLKPELMYSYNGERLSHYWLKDVATSTDFTAVSYEGNSGYGAANNQFGVRPRFLIGEFFNL